MIGTTSRTGDLMGYQVLIRDGDETVETTGHGTKKYDEPVFEVGLSHTQE